MSKCFLGLTAMLHKASAPDGLVGKHCPRDREWILRKKKKKCNQVGTIIMCALLHYQPGNINNSKWKTNFFLHYTVMQAGMK